jgi:hypothetical protein
VRGSTWDRNGTVSAWSFWVSRGLSWHWRGPEVVNAGPNWHCANGRRPTDSEGMIGRSGSYCRKSLFVVWRSVGCGAGTALSLVKLVKKYPGVAMKRAPGGASVSGRGFLTCERVAYSCLQPRSGLTMDFYSITADRRVMAGVPCIRGLRNPVATVVGMVADGMSADEILAASGRGRALKRMVCSELEVPGIVL